MTLEREANSATVSEAIPAQEQYDAKSEALKRRLPLHIAAATLKLPLSVVLEAARRGFIPTQLHSSGFRFALLADVIAGVNRMRAEDRR